MKSNHVISITKPLSLSDLDIRPMEICWSKVKMNSPRWIACCHRRVVWHTPPSSKYQPLSLASSMGRTRPEPHHQSPSFVRSLAARPSNHYHVQPPHQHHYPHSPAAVKNVANLSNGLISSSYQTPQRDRHNGLPSSVSSTNSQLTPSNASPLSNSSLYELGRKSSSSSSSSSNSFTLTNGDRLGHGHAMKHSRSTIDLASSLSAMSHSSHQPRHLRHPQHYRQKDDMCVPSSSVENTITILSPLDGLLINCQTNGDSNCAQISPQLNVIAVSNEFWIAFYSIKTNECLGTLQFPSKCLFWTWIRANTVAVVTEKEVYHWSLPAIDADSNYVQTGDFLRLIFSIDCELRDNQITDYSVDPIFSNWCALSTLFVDDEGEIGGKVQIYSHSYGQSQCIEAHSCAFTSYQFGDSDHSSTLLVAVKRQKERTWKLHIIELGPIPAGNLSHKPINQLLCAHNKRIGVVGEGGQTEDIPTHIVCDPKLGLIYLLSKYGSFYICDLETGVPLYYDLIDCADGYALFSFAFDPTTDSLIAISRSGQVLSIRMSLGRLCQESDTNKVAPKVWERIRAKLQQVKGITVQSELTSQTESSQLHSMNEQSHYLSVSSYDSAHSSGSNTTSSSSSSASLPPLKPTSYHYGQTGSHNAQHYHSLAPQYEASQVEIGGKPAQVLSNQPYLAQLSIPAEPIFDGEDHEEGEEIITRL